MREQGFGSDAERPSLTEVGMPPYARRSEACPLCGIIVATGEKVCPHCGGFQHLRQRERESPPPASGQRPSLPATDTAIEPTAVRAQGSTTEPLGASAFATTPAVTERGERLVAWSALAALAFAGLVFVQRLGEAPDTPAATRLAAVVPRAETLAPRPVEAAVSPVPLRSAATLASAPADGPVQATIAAARHVAKPVAKNRAQGRRKPPVPREPETDSPPVSDPVAAVDPAPWEPVQVAAVRTPWDAMHDEIAACPTDDFIGGVMCQQRIRIRYCIGWWGQVSDCPTRQGPYGN